MSALVIRNIGTVASGDARAPRLDVTEIHIHDGIIEAAARPGEREVEIDAAGGLVCPGLWDSFAVLAFGDFEPELDAHGHLARTVAFGTTTVVSAGALTLPGRPRDARGATYLGVLAACSWAHDRPGGITAHAGTIVWAPGMDASTLRLAAAAGVGRLAIVEPFRTLSEAASAAQLARAAGLRIVADCGTGSLVAGRRARTALAVIGPDLCVRVNGPRPLAAADATWLLDRTSAFLGIAPGGSFKAAARIVAAAARRNALERIVIGTRTPAEGVIAPDGVGRLAAYLATLRAIGPEVALAIASGNAARAHALPGGHVAFGMPADLLLFQGAGARTALADGYWRAPDVVLVGGNAVA